MKKTRVIIWYDEQERPIMRHDGELLSYCCMNLQRLTVIQCRSELIPTLTTAYTNTTSENFVSSSSMLFSYTERGDTWTLNMSSLMTQTAIGFSVLYAVASF
jgi:hypothetical protein